MVTNSFLGHNSKSKLLCFGFLIDFSLFTGQRLTGRSENVANFVLWALNSILEASAWHINASINYSRHEVSNGREKSTIYTDFVVENTDFSVSIAVDCREKSKYAVSQAKIKISDQIFAFSSLFRLYCTSRIVVAT